MLPGGPAHGRISLLPILSPAPEAGPRERKTTTESCAAMACLLLSYAELTCGAGLTARFSASDLSWNTEGRAPGGGEGDGDTLFGVRPAGVAVGDGRVEPCAEPAR